MKILTHRKFGRTHPFKTFRDKKEYLDLKLTSESNTNEYIVCHRIVLASASPQLRKLFKNSPDPDQPVTVRKVNPNILSLVVNFIYEGKVELPDDIFEDFCDSMRLLNVKLGGNADKIIYGDDNDDEDDTSTIVDDNKSAFINETSTNLKRENPKLVQTSPTGFKPQPWCFTPEAPSNTTLLPTPTCPISAPLLPSLGQSLDQPLMPSLLSGISSRKRTQPHPSPDMSGPQVKRRMMNLEELDMAATRRGIAPPSDSVAGLFRFFFARFVKVPADGFSKFSHTCNQNWPK